MSRGAVLFVVLLASACYQPADDPHCAVRCDHASATPSCPDGLSCGTDNRCYRGTQCDQEPVDASVDDTTIVDGQTCIGLGYLHLCPAPMANADLAFDMPLALNTDTCGASANFGGVSVCFILASNITISAPLTVTGTQPLLLMALDTLEITPTGVIDVSAGGGGTGPSVCGGAHDALDGNTASADVGGGAGGSLAGTGGTGGGPIAATAAPGAMPTNLRGGCPGGRGGRAQVGLAGGGGQGGGAVYLMAGKMLNVSGRVYAWGAGGGAAVGAVGGYAGGGGGGGSGGMIVLDAPMIMFTSGSMLLADGGGGGGGATNGAAAESGGVTNPNALGPASNGGVKTCPGCGPGGIGSFVTRNGNAGSAGSGGNSGGGGGGGGAGFIRYFTPTPVPPVATVRPPPTTN